VIRSRIIFTLGIILLYRFLANVPPLGIDVEQFNNILNNNPLSNIFTIATGGRLDNPSLVMIGMGPYINASIIIQLLSTVIPKLEQLSKEGNQGRQVLNMYTRYLTIPLSIMQSIVVYVILSRSAIIISGGNELSLNLVAFIATIAAGSILMMWLGELISEKGVGNGSSILISFGIIASLPAMFLTDFGSVGQTLLRFYEDTISGRLTLNGAWEILSSPSMLYAYGIIIFLMILVSIIVWMSEGTRKVKVNYSRRVGGEQINYLPLRVNQSGVMPIIFASAVLAMPGILAQLTMSITDTSSTLYRIGDWINNSFLVRYNSFEYLIVDVVMIIAFSYFYIFVVTKPSNIAENINKSGGYIPGIRPGRATTEYLNSVLFQLTTIGGLFLAVIAIMPAIFRSFYAIDTASIGIVSAIGGTSLLIIVSVLLLTYRQIQSLKVSKSYDKYR
jgi:preprotein translocase subunit SecY